jgi:dTDP-4-dehydrorhamnose reductase
MMRILLLGMNGQLGWESRRALAPLGEVIALDYPQIDLTRPQTIAGLVTEVKPQVVFNATAYTLVDQAETESEKCRLINAVAPGEMAQAARKIGAAFVHFSTDYVFDGQKTTPYSEEDAPHPLNAYGQDKLAGEQAVAQAGGAYLILRTAWVYSNRRESFVSKVLEWAAKNPNLRIVDDQVSGPTWARALAETTALLLAQSRADPWGWLEERAGLYHLSGRGWCSRLDWAKEILRLAGQGERTILPAKTAEFPAPAKRPLYTPLDCAKFERTFDLRLPDWQQALQLAMAKI